MEPIESLTCNLNLIETYTLNCISFVEIGRVVFKCPIDVLLTSFIPGSTEPIELKFQDDT